MVRIIAFGLVLISFNGSMAFSQTRLQANETFDKMRLLVPIGDKLKATKVMLRFEADRLVLRTSKDGDDLKVFPYGAIKSAEYTFSRGPRDQSSPGLTLLANVFAISLFATQVERHRLEFRTDRDYALLDLDKNNYKVLLSAFENSTGKKVTNAEDGRFEVLRSASIGK